MKLNDFISRLSEVQNSLIGEPEPIVRAWDPELKDWVAITGFVYGSGTAFLNIHTEETD